MTSTRYTLIPLVRHPNGEGLRIDAPTELVQASLRARTCLAYLYFNNLLVERLPADNPLGSLSMYSLWTLQNMDREKAIEWALLYAIKLGDDGEPPRGAMMVASDPTVGWSAQSPTLLLQRDYTPRIIESQLAQSMRWLNDRDNVKRTLQLNWPLPEANHAQA